MTEVVWAFALVLLFVLLLRRLRLVEESRDVVGLSRSSLETIRDATLDDEVKEKRLQANTLTLFRHFVSLSIRGGIALLAPAGIAWGAAALGWVSLDDLLRVSVSPAFLGAAAVVALVAMPRSGGRARAGDRANAGAYSGPDRAVHRVAFHSRDAQVAVASLEDRWFRERLAAVSVERPVFITALPRAGTTLLLEIFAGSPEFASHTYRDMPFVLTPMLWDRVGGRFRTGTHAMERAHGDGIRIGLDSPEAFEEMVWLAFGGDAYAADRILPWARGVTPDFAAFLERHMRKIVGLRTTDCDPVPRRYVSKNNLNIARSGALKAVFPDASIVVPFRDPVNHVASLHTQHLNFLSIHADDPFAGEYMRGIGHFDFGVHLRPVDFDGWYDDRTERDARAPAFWLEYWVATYRYLLDRAHRFVFVDYDGLCADPGSTLDAVARAVGSALPEALRAGRERVRPPSGRRVDPPDAPDGLLRAARDTYEQLKAAAE